MLISMIMLVFDNKKKMEQRLGVSQPAHLQFSIYVIRQTNSVCHLKVKIIFSFRARSRNFKIIYIKFRFDIIATELKFPGWFTLVSFDWLT